MKTYKYIFSFFILLTALNLAAINSTEKRDNRISGKLTYTISVPINNVWQAILYTLKNDSWGIKNINEETKEIMTDYKYASPDINSDSLLAKRITFMTSWDNTLAIWKGTRYSVSFKLIPIDEMQTTLEMILKAQVQETNTTNVWHTCLSNGKYENELFEKIKANVTLIQNRKDITLPQRIEFYYVPDYPSQTIKKAFTGDYATSFSILEKIIKTCGFNIKKYDKSLGVLVVDGMTIDERQEEYILLEKPIIDKGAFGDSEPSWKDDIQCTLLFNLSHIKTESNSIFLELNSYLRKYENRVTGKWYSFASSGKLENMILSVFENALKNSNEYDYLEFTNLHLTETKSFMLNYPLLKTWQAVLQTLGELNFTISEFFADSSILGVTDFKEIDEKYKSLMTSLKPIGKDSTCLITTVSTKENSNKLTGIDSTVLRTEDSLYDVFQEKLMNNLKTGLKADTCDTDYLNDPEIVKIPSTDRKNLFCSILKLYQKVKLHDNFIIYPLRIHKEVVGDESYLVIPFYFSYPIRYEDQLDYNKLINTFVQKALFHICNITANCFYTSEALSKIKIELAFKCYNIDENTPLDNKVRVCSLIGLRSDLIKYTLDKVDIQKLMNDFIIKIDSIEINGADYPYSFSIY